jgi:son of sevenless
MLMTQTVVPALVQGQTSNSYNSRKPQQSESTHPHDYTDQAHPALGESNVGYSQDYASRFVMNGIAGSAPPGTMYVRALYDYEADDRTSLSFHEGDIIQVITQLESGWWDGVINGVRGWFPSNYCQIITSPDDVPDVDQNADADQLDEDIEDQDVYDDQLEEDDESEQDGMNSLPLEGTDGQDRSRADFWIPQATPDGRLFYYNMMTGDRSMELPLESPVSATETGPRDRMNVNIPERTRPPPEMMARGMMQDEDEDSEVNSASEMEGESLMLASRGSLVRLPAQLGLS